MIKEAIILAAGKGNRMKIGQTDSYIINTPKPLLEFDGIPIVERSIKNLLKYGIKVSIVINPLDEEKFRKKLHSYNLNFIYQDKPMGTAHALFSAKNFIEGDLFLVLMGDDLIEFGDENILEIDTPTVFGYHVEDVKNYGVIISDKDGYAIKIIEKNISGPGLVNTGVYVMPKEFFNLYNKIPVDKYSKELYLTEVVKLLYDQGLKMKIRTLKFWKGINTPKDLYEANEIYKNFVKIRKARLEDLPYIIDLLNQLSPMSNYEKEKNNVSVKNAMINILNNDDYCMLVAEMDGKIVGTGTLLIQQNLSHGGRPYGHIENVVVDKDYRKRSIGEKIIENLVVKAKERNCYKVILNCSKENITFYEKCGFFLTNEVEMRINLNLNSDL